jgi:ATP phosphoribosyltransferase
MLRVAVPNKGQLNEPALAMLREAGYLMNSQARDLVVQDPDNDVEFFFLRPRDIATYVGAGTLDLGITGRDMLLDSGADADEVLALGFAPATFRLAAPQGRAESVMDFSGMRIATSYGGLLAAYLKNHAVDARVVVLEGAVENAVRLGVADAVADVVATGSTMRQAGLVPVGEPILVSEALLVRRRGVPTRARPPSGSGARPAADRTWARQAAERQETMRAPTPRRRAWRRAGTRPRRRRGTRASPRRAPPPRPPGPAWRRGPPAARPACPSRPRSPAEAPQTATA